MNKVISVYELLGLIKDGKAPKKIEYNDLECIYDDDYKNYYIPDCVEYLIDGMNIVDDLNNKVEILEEDKPIIEKLGKKFTLEGNTSELTKSDWQFSVISQKINELVDEINKLKKEK